MEKKYYRTVIHSNKVKCLLCEDTIESRHGHDFRYCKCGNVAVDGGKNYLRRVFSGGPESWLDISHTTEEEREPYEWEKDV